MIYWNHEHVVPSKSWRLDRPSNPAWLLHWVIKIFAFGTLFSDFSGVFRSTFLELSWSRWYWAYRWSDTEQNSISDRESSPSTWCFSTPFTPSSPFSTTTRWRTPASSRFCRKLDVSLSDRKRPMWRSVSEFWSWFPNSDGFFLRIKRAGPKIRVDGWIPLFWSQTPNLTMFSVRVPVFTYADFVRSFGMLAFNCSLLPMMVMSIVACYSTQRISDKVAAWRFAGIALVSGKSVRKSAAEPR